MIAQTDIEFPSWSELGPASAGVVLVVAAVWFLWRFVVKPMVETIMSYQEKKED